MDEIKPGLLRHLDPLSQRRAGTDRATPPGGDAAGRPSAFQGELERTLAASAEAAHSPKVSEVLQEVEQANADQHALERQADALRRQWAALGHPRRR